MPKKIVIIGAGPIGCYSAQVLKKNGFQTILVEEHSEVGRPVHCTGLVGSKVFDEKKQFSIPRSSIINKINGAVIHYENQQFIIERKNVAYLIDREKFDKDMSKGLDILYQNKFIGIEDTKDGYVVETDKDEILSDIVIGADGANSMVRRILKNDPRTINLKGIQFRIRMKPRYKDFVEVYFKRPSFFWMVPECEDVVRVGTISENPYKDLQKFLTELKIREEIIERFGGLVSVGVCERTVRDGIAVVGDAACQVKPLTYGGIYFGLMAADILTNCIKKDRLQDYDPLWKKELVSEIRIGLKVKEIYDNLNDHKIEEIFNLIKSQKSLIEKMGDFENHSSLIFELIKRPAFYPYVGGLFKLLFNKLV